jgi:hypothetical protein
VVVDRLRPLSADWFWHDAKEHRLPACASLNISSAAADEKAVAGLSSCRAFGAHEEAEKISETRLN